MTNRFVRVALCAAAAPFLLGCGLTTVEDPSTVISGEIVQSQTGAVGLYSESVTKFNRAFGGGNAFSRWWSFVSASGLASDEFSTALNTGEQWAYHLRRVEYDAPYQTTQPYADMHAARLQVDQAIGALKTYGITSPSSYVAQLYALRGYLAIMFADLYCSGVPFSRAVYGGDIVLDAGKSTEQMYLMAVADFDSALAVTTDSARIRQLATVGKARALLALNKPADAAALVSEASVPTDFRYDAVYNASLFPSVFAYYGGNVADRAGANGLPYNTSAPGDPRVAWYRNSNNEMVPSKFPNAGAPIPVAEGREARLIEAEAKLRSGDAAGWALILNTLRRTATPAIDTLKSDSTSGASATLRENVMFRERAFWLYGTGHRMGDLRRLVRQFNRPMSQTFPAGASNTVVPPNNLFSDYPNFSPPKAEQDSNPNYHGCFNRDA